MAAYVQITSGEMAEFMSALGFQELSVRERTPERMLKQSRAVKESVFEKPMGAGKIRIYSTVQGGQGRKVGRDAIRVQYWVDGVKVYGATRVHRVTNWRKNLLNRIYEIEDMVSTGALRQVPKDSSGRPMVVRSARRDKSKFWGSSDYPRNRETRRFESSVIMPKKPTTAVEKAVMWKRAIEIADLQYMMMELENKVRLGIINEEDLMKSLQEKFGAEDWQESDGTWVVNDEIMIPSRACDECESEMEIFSVDYDKRNKSIVEITYVCECLVKAAEYTTVTNSPLGEIVQDESGRRFVLLDEAFAQIIFEQSNKSFNAEWRESELLYPEEIESLMAIGSPNSKVFYAVRLEGDETAEYIVQQEEIDEDLMYRILLVLEEELEPVETFASIEGYGNTAGGLDEMDAMLGRKSRNQPQESELAQENNRMRKLIREGRAVYTRKGWVEVDTPVSFPKVKYVNVSIDGQELDANKKFLRKQLNAEDRDMEERMTRVEAEALADKMITALEPYVDFSEVCGSFRRGRKDPGDLDVVIIMKPGESLPEIIDKLSGLYTAINWLGEKKTQIIVDGVKVDIKVSNAEGIGAALLYFTGPSGYNIGMRRSAKKRGLKLNEYGIWNRDTNEYLGGATEEEIYDVLGKTYKPPEMRAEYESVIFRSGGHSEYAPTERIIQRLKDSGVWELGEAYDSEGLQYIWWATVKIEDGTLVPMSLPEDFFAEDLINLVLLVDTSPTGMGRLAVSIADMDNAEMEDTREWDEELTQLGKELTIVFQNNGMFQSDDDLQRGGMGEYFDVYWGNLVNHSCADNAKFDIYEEDEGEGLITMECMKCGRTAIFRQETPYEGPRNAETFGAESIKEGFCPACGETDLMVQYYDSSGDFGCFECGHQWFEKSAEEETREELLEETKREYPDVLTKTEFLQVIEEVFDLKQVVERYGLTNDHDIQQKMPELNSKITILLKKLHPIGHPYGAYIEDDINNDRYGGVYYGGYRGMASEEEEDEEPLDDDEYWEPYWEAVEEYWRMCDAYVAEAGESYQGMVQHINFWQEVAEASSHSLNYVLEKAWKFKYDALRMIYNGDAVSGHEWVLEQLSKKDYELLDDFNPENRYLKVARGLPVYVDTNYSPGVPTLTWLKDNLNPWYLRREEGKPYAFDLYR